ncbi:helix-turn-helix domain-containing protein [Glutamicibacter sp. MNS18]|uniref:IclR family transcriptional regulator domain-containing protein n=1 Tax=Glutamicibacter sp. MNS18 TaxID=2989817 RepID=UPI002236AFA1|nr:IclR family transcriptional regulator C-terminal domain-containing protein [Glutamicibacter sp. MNS18]MCW4465583.1 helix-turn-helix domain-containing protein [Glutamicibacter sp. MNS18]
MAAEQPDYFVKSAEKTLSVLLAFNGHSDPRTVSQIATAIESTRATARRFLLTLTDLGYLETVGNAYRLTPRVLDIGASYLSGLTLPQVAAPHLQRLAAELGETTALCVLDGQDILYVERVLSPRLHATNSTIGNRLPAWVTSMGRVLMSKLPAAEREEFLSRIELTHYTDKTVSSIEALRAELDQVAAQGWSMVAQELDEGLRGLAVPVYRGTQLLGALNVSVQPGRMERESITGQMVPLMQQVAQDIADDFGGRLGRK